MEDISQLLYERFQILASAVFFFLLFLLAARKNGYFSFSRVNREFLGELPNKIFAWSLVLFLALQLLVTPLTFEFWYYFYTLGEAKASRHISAELQGWINIYGILVTGLGMLLYYFSLPQKTRKIVFGEYAFIGWKAKLHDFYVALMSWVLSYPLVLAVGQIISIILLLTYQNVEPEQVAVKQIKTASTSTALLSVLILLVIFIVPVIEELLFRGFFQNWLKKFMGPWNAILATSIIFALFHFSPSQGMGNIELIVSLFVLSCFLGYIYERQKSLWAPISLHAIFNAISVMLIIYVEKEGA